MRGRALEMEQGWGAEGRRRHLKEAAHGAGIPTRAHSHSPEIMTSAQIEPMSHGGAPRKIPPKKGYKLALNWQGWLGASGKGGSCRWSTVPGALRPRQDTRGLRPRPPAPRSHRQARRGLSPNCRPFSLGARALRAQQPQWAGGPGPLPVGAGAGQSPPPRGPTTSLRLTAGASHGLVPQGPPLASTAPAPG